MKALVTLAVAAALWQAIAAQPAGAVETCQRRARRCSTPPRPSAKAQDERAIAAARRLAAGERIVVPIAYHVIYGSYTPLPGEEPDDLEHAPPLALVNRQTEALKRALRGTAFSFSTAEATLVDFAPWREGEGAPGWPAPGPWLAAMIQDLTADRSDVLHVFLMRRAESRAAIPETKSIFDSGEEADGIVMDWDYLPYVEALRPIADRRLRRLYFQGETLVHLFGHYAGLLHTFEEAEGDCLGRCSLTTDFVRDTPAHRWTWDDDGRCIPIDTCPNLPGMDPMTNYMNLEPDLCASEFTPGQVERMERMVRLYRPNFVVQEPAGDSR